MYRCRGTHGARSENRLFEKSSPSSAARHWVSNVARNSQRVVEERRLVIVSGAKNTEDVGMQANEAGEIVMYSSETRQLC